MIRGIYKLKNILRKIRVIDDVIVSLAILLYIAPHDHGRCCFYRVEFDISQRVNQPAV